MKITLDYSEIRLALIKALEEKTQCIFGEINSDDCYFHGLNDIEDFSDIEFTADILTP